MTQAHHKLSKQLFNLRDFCHGFLPIGYGDIYYYSPPSLSLTTLSLTNLINFDAFWHKNVFRENLINFDKPHYL